MSIFVANSLSSLWCAVLYFLLPTMIRSAAQLHFRYGAVSSAKTLNLLAVSHTYKVQGKLALVMKVCIFHLHKVCQSC